MKECHAPGCGVTFTPIRNQRYCSRQCAARMVTRRRLGISAPPGTRPCKYCTDPFTSTDGRQLYCSNDCTRIGKTLRRAPQLYGITMQEYRAIWLRQGGACAVCRQPEKSTRNRLLAIDHDHVSGQVRGLLCSHCNRAIGLLGDDPKTIRAAAEYVSAGRQLRLIV